MDEDNKILIFAIFLVLFAIIMFSFNKNLVNIEVGSITGQAVIDNIALNINSGGIASCETNEGLGCPVVIDGDSNSYWIETSGFVRIDLGRSVTVDRVVVKTGGRIASGTLYLKKSDLTNADVNYPRGRDVDLNSQNDVTKSNLNINNVKYVQFSIDSLKAGSNGLAEVEVYTLPVLSYSCTDNEDNDCRSVIDGDVGTLWSDINEGYVRVDLKMNLKVNKVVVKSDGRIASGTLYLKKSDLTNADVNYPRGRDVDLNSQNDVTKSNLNINNVRYVQFSIDSLKPGNNLGSIKELDIYVNEPGCTASNCGGCGSLTACNGASCEWSSDGNCVNGCPSGTTKCSDGSCRIDCGTTPGSSCNEDDTCNADEGCNCVDCYIGNNKQDSCASGLVCLSSTQKCGLPPVTGCSSSNCVGCSSTNCEVNGCTWTGTSCISCDRNKCITRNSVFSGVCFGKTINECKTICALKPSIDCTGDCDYKNNKCYPITKCVFTNGHCCGDGMEWDSVDNICRESSKLCYFIFPNCSPDPMNNNRKTKDCSLLPLETKICWYIGSEIYGFWMPYATY